MNRAQPMAAQLISRILLMHDASDSLIYHSARKSEDWELATTTVNTKGRITS